MPKKKLLLLTASAMLSSTPAVHAATQMTDQQLQQFMQTMSAQMHSMQTEVNGLQTEVKTLNTQLTQEKAKNAKLVAQTQKQPAPAQTQATPSVVDTVSHPENSLLSTNASGWQPVAAPKTQKQKVSSGATLVSSNNQVPAAPKPLSEILGPVFTSPYIGSNMAYNGSDLMINQSSVNLDVQLLKQRQQLANVLSSYGYSFPDHSMVEMSGKVEFQAIANQPSPGPSSETVNLSTSELEAYAMVNPCVAGFIQFDYDDTPPANSPNPLLNSRIYLENGFISLGNFNKTSFYSTMGQLYVPFGQYASYMLSTPLTQSLGRVQQRSVVFGYRPAEGFYTSGYVFHDNTTGSSNGAGGGADIGYSVSHGNNDLNIALSGISNLAESQGMQQNGAPANIPFAGFGLDAKTEVLHHEVPGVDVDASADIGDFTLLGEYVAATRAFSPLDLSFNDSGAKPTAAHLEGDYNFTIYGKPSTFGVGYEHTTESLALLLPEQTYFAVLNVSPWEDTVASLQLRHGINYSGDDVASGAGSANFGPIDGTINSLTFQFGVYF